jgi:hypothetical protein
MGYVNKVFAKIGEVCGEHPYLTLFFTLSLSIFCCLGFIHLELEDDPQGLWVSSTSRGNIEQEYFRENFGAFFRINTFALRIKDHDDQSDIFFKPYLEMIFQLQVFLSFSYDFRKEWKKKMLCLKDSTSMSQKHAISQSLEK